MTKKFNKRPHKEILLVPILGLFMVLIPLLLLGMAFVKPEALELTFPSSDQKIAVGHLPQTEIHRLEIVTQLGDHGRRFVKVYPDKGDSLHLEYTGRDLSLILDQVIEPSDSVETIAGIEMDDHLPYDDLVQILDVLRKNGVVNTLIYPPKTWMEEIIEP
ncbi:MAG: biopolymer transporter ExbD [Candidatus Cloacimonetes bacterium]|nr:biopolymer transporter ExbD [Candidatus Cloacimonadota bacterium]